MSTAKWDLEDAKSQGQITSLGMKLRAITWNPRVSMQLNLPIRFQVVLNFGETCSQINS